MTDSRQRRADTLRQAARRKSVRGEAGVSHAFLCGNADLPARRERLRGQARPKPSPPEGAGSDDTIIQALTSQITHLKKQHGHENAVLRAALEQAHGENLELRRELARLGGNL